MFRNRFLLAWAFLASFTLFACAGGDAGQECEPGFEEVEVQAANGTQLECQECQCGSVNGECVPCIDVDPGIEVPDGGFGEVEIIDEELGYFLNQEGDGRFVVYVNEQSRIGVRVTSYYGRPTDGVRINFEINELDPNRISGAQLSTRTAESNDFGVAAVNVRAGLEPTFFELVLSADQPELIEDDTRELRYMIEVRQRPDFAVGGDPTPRQNQQNCLRTKGTYDIVNRYQPASILGDGFNNTLMTIHQLLTDPGSLVGDLIRDRIGGIGGSIIRGVIRPVVNYVFDYVVQNYLPDWAQRTLRITEDITAIMTDLEIQGAMILGDENPMDCTLQGVHRWETLIFFWSANCDPNANNNCGRHEIPMNELGIAASETPFNAHIDTQGIGETMVIEEHRLQMNIGVALIWFIERTILPGYFDNVNSFGQLLQMVIPCNVVAQQAASRVGGGIFGLAIDVIVQEACEEGLDAAGDWIARELASGLSLDTFTMAGECQLRDTNGDSVVDRLTNGIWSEGLEGTFEGERAGGRQGP